MSDADNAGFGKFVPGFDFLQNLAKNAGASVPQMPNISHWVAPTLNVEELDKRIGELKNVQFWLEQNSRALAATIQALEVQKMTLATLQGMNFSLTDVANAFKLKAADSVSAGLQKATASASSTAKVVGDVAGGASKTAKAAAKGATKAAQGGAGMVDPLQLWGSLTQQFQQIAASAIKEVTTKTATDLGKNMAAGLARQAAKSTVAAGKQAVAKAARKTTARKAAPR